MFFRLYTNGDKILIIHYHRKSKNLYFLETLLPDFHTENFCQSRLAIDLYNQKTVSYNFSFYPPLLMTQLLDTSMTVAHHLLVL